MGQNEFLISVSFLEWKKDLSVPCSIFQQWLQKTFLHPYLPCWSFFCYKIWNYTWVKRVFLKRVMNGSVNGIFISNAINSRFFLPFTFPKLLIFDSLGVNKINSTLLIMFDFGCWICLHFLFFFFKYWINILGVLIFVRFYGGGFDITWFFFTQHLLVYLFIYILF